MKFAPTRISRLVVYVFLSIPVGWAVANAWPTLFGNAMQVSMLAPLMAAVLSVVASVHALQIRRALRENSLKARIGPSFIARSVVLAMAISRVSAVSAGFYLGIHVYYQRHDVGQVSKESLVPTALVVVLSLILIGIGLWMEGMAKIPPSAPAGEDTNRS